MSNRTQAEWNEWGAGKGVTFAPLWNRVGMTREQNRQADALLAENQRLREDCPICGHKWRQHDPEDGRCDSHSSEGIGVCECGRDMAWMNGKIAALSREALAGDGE